MTITLYPAALSPYPSPRAFDACRVNAADYPTHDGLCIKLGPLGVSLTWRRKSN